jgi:hypothetical protein
MYSTAYKSLWLCVILYDMQSTGPSYSEIRKYVSCRHQDDADTI